MKIEKVVLADVDSVAKTAAVDLANEIIKLLGSNSKANLVITGGSVGIKTLEQLAPLLQGINLAGLHIWWGDERFVAADSNERNQLQANQALIEKISLPSENLHPFPSSDHNDLMSAANSFADEIGKAAPTFDVLLLGMGPDGHVASLFPQETFQAVSPWVVIESNSPKPPDRRISLSYQAINSSDQVWLLVAGAEKADATKEVFAGNSNLPAARIAGKKLTRWYLDKAAAAGITS
ncbi:MAG: 6-phosphogluconolactonase [Actinomycetota bacterium]